MLSRNLHFLSRKIKASSLSEMKKFILKFWRGDRIYLGEGYGDLTVDAHDFPDTDKVKEFETEFKKKFPEATFKYHSVGDGEIIRIGIENIDSYLHDSVNELKEFLDFLLAVGPDLGLTLDEEGIKKELHSSGVDYFEYRLNIQGKPGYIYVKNQGNYEIIIKKGDMHLLFFIDDLIYDPAYWDRVSEALKYFSGDCNYKYNREDAQSFKESMGFEDPRLILQNLEGAKISFNEKSVTVSYHYDRISFCWDRDWEKNEEDIYKAIDLLKSL